MFQECWQEQLRRAMSSLKANSGRPRVAIVGIGHELRGDDAAGIEVTRRLAARCRNSQVLVIEGGAAPENFCGLICRHEPDLVLFVDAADMVTDPGAIAWLPWQAMNGCNDSTHSISLRLLSSYLITRTGCQVALLGIQPANLTMNATLSPAVAEAVKAAAQMLESQIGIEEGAAVL